MRVLQKIYLGAVLALIVAAIAAFGATTELVWSTLAAIACIGLAALALVALLKGIPLPWDWLLLPVIGFGSLVFAQWALNISTYRGATLSGLVELAGAGATFYMSLFVLASKRMRRIAAWALYVLTGVLAAEALAQYFTAFRYVYWYRPAFYATPIGPFIYHNHFAGCMDLLFPFTLVIAFDARPGQRADWLQRTRRSLVPALAIIAVVVSQSRGGLFALAFELLVFAVISGRAMLREGRQRRTLAFAAAFLAGFVALAAWGPMMRRIGDLGSHDVSVAERWQVALSAFAIWRTYPWMGSGFNTFATIYPRYQRFDVGKPVLEAHDEYIQALAETGIAGIVCVLGFLGIFVAESRAGWRRSRSNERSVAYQKAAFIACSGFLFHSAGDFQFHAYANALLFFFVAAFAVARSNTGSGQARPHDADHQLQVVA